MKNIGYSDFIELIDKYLDGTATAAQKECLAAIFAGAGRSELFDKISNEGWGTASGMLDSETRDRIWQSIRTEVVPAEKKVVRAFWSKGWVRAAAMIAVIAMVGLAGYHSRDIFEREQSGEPFKIAVASGQKANIALPDGTIVWMNSMSTLTYDAAYNKNDRLVTLEGEAYFDVAKDPSRKFVVATQGVEIEALGTAFNVKSYADDEFITTSLVDGKVRVSYDDKAIELEPHQSSVFNKNIGQFRKFAIDDVAAVDFWRTDNLIFDAAPMGQIARTLERMYGVNILFVDDDLKDISFSGTINNNSISNVFHIMSLTYPITYAMEGDTITIARRKR